MDCERFDKLSLDLLYGELDDLSAASAKRHLHHCTRCQNIWSKLRATQELATLEFEEPPDDLFESILAAEREAQKRLSLGERLGRSVSVLADYAMRPQLAMAALLFLMIGSGLVLWRSNPRGLKQVVAVEDGAISPEPHGEPTRPGSAGEDLSAVGVDMNRSSSVPSGVKAAAAESRAMPTPSESYAVAMKAYEEGRYAEAERLFAEVAASDAPKAASAALYEANSARNGSGCQRAATLYDQVSARYSGSTVADDASYQAALCYRALGRADRAIAHYELLAEKPAFRARAEAALAELRGDRAVASRAAADTSGTSADAESAARAKSPAAAAKPATAPAAAAAPEAPAEVSEP